MSRSQQRSKPLPFIGNMSGSISGMPGGALSDITIKQALIAPAILAVAAITVAAALASITGVDGTRLFYPYVSAWSAVSLVALLSWVFVEVAKLAPSRAERPLQIVAARLGRPVQMIVLPGLIFPIFLGAYTWAKCSIPFTVGYGWERTWSDADRLLLGSDAWQITHAIMPPSTAFAWTYFYAVIWGFALVFSGALIAAFASRRHTAIFFTAMMMSWLIGGVGLAYAISAAGPVFAHLVDPEVGSRFSMLRADLITLLGNENFVMRAQRYLAGGMNVKIALQGSGVSAMPSMHIATATILVLASLRTRWLYPALAFLLLTFVGSVHLGYHYAVDAPVAALVAAVCWWFAVRIYREPAPGTASNQKLVSSQVLRASEL